MLRDRAMQSTTPHQGLSREEQYVELAGRVVEVLPAGMFRVELQAGSRVLAQIAGRLRRNRIRIVLGDIVTVAVSAYDPRRGRITYRR
jgi:translation initiation factor IF-1